MLKPLQSETSQLVCRSLCSYNLLLQDVIHYQFSAAATVQEITSTYQILQTIRPITMEQVTVFSSRFIAYALTITYVVKYLLMTES